jgi:hypothetical protein
VLGFAIPLLALTKFAKMLGQNHFAKPKQQVLIILHPILICNITIEHH